MIATVLVACVAIPLVLLVVDVVSPKKAKAGGVPHDEIRPHVTASTAERRDPHRAEAPPQPEPAPRAPRIAPGDGMVYRPAQRSSRPR